MAITVTCRSCGRESASAAFCGWCAAPLDASSAETAPMTGGPSSPALSSSSSVDEGRFLPGTVPSTWYPPLPARKAEDDQSALTPAPAAPVVSAPRPAVAPGMAAWARFTGLLI